MNDADYYRSRAAQAQNQAARAEGCVRSIHLEFAARYAEEARRAMGPMGAAVPAR